MCVCVLCHSIQADGFGTGMTDVACVHVCVGGNNVVSTISACTLSQWGHFLRNKHINMYAVNMNGDVFVSQQTPPDRFESNISISQT